jgi:hypothetical protein
MSFGDLYTVAAGQGNPPGLPAIDLPKTEAPPRRPLRIEIRPDSKSSGGVWDSLPDFKPAKASADEHADGIWGDMPEHSPEAEKEAKNTFREVSTGEAFGRSAVQGASFGLYPALSGALAAGREGGAPKSVEPEPGVADALMGLVRMGYEHFVSPEGKATKAYREAREEAQGALEAGRKQHPYASFAGELMGTAAVPLPGLAAAAAPARIGRGAAFGGLGGAAYGGGTALSEGKDIGDIGKGALIGGGLGAVTGAAFGGLLGPRAPTLTPGQRAAQTAEALGAPLPRGVAADSRALQATTAKLRQVPFAGERIGHRVEVTQEAAGERLGDIASHMTGGATDRAAADAIVRPGLQTAIDANRATIDANYNALRGLIDQNRRFVLPRTQRTLQDIRQNRAAAGWPNPSQGLEQFENVASGAGFNGTHRARVDAREAGNALVPHPGYNSADYNRITRAMTADLRDMVATTAHNQTPAGRSAALAAFDRAEGEFGRFADQNAAIHRLINSRGEGAIATLLGSSREKGGNVRLLAQLRGSMQPADFQQIGGVLLTELGHNNATGRFSLSQFTTNWDKVSDRAKSILFSPQHLQNIEDIAEMGGHIKGALRESTTSHSAGLLVLLDVAKDAALLGSDIASGGLGAGSAIGAGTTAGVWMLARWLGNPAIASSAAAWNRARLGYLGHPTPTRLAVFNIATRNLSHNTGVPAEHILSRSAIPASGRSEVEQPEGQGSVRR